MARLSPGSLLAVENSLSPLPNRLRLLAECVEGDASPYPEAVADLLMEWAERIENQVGRLHALCRLLTDENEEARHA